MREGVGSNPKKDVLPKVGCSVARQAKTTDLFETLTTWIEIIGLSRSVQFRLVLLT